MDTRDFQNACRNTEMYVSDFLSDLCVDNPVREDTHPVINGVIDALMNWQDAIFQKHYHIYEDD